MELMMVHAFMSLIIIELPVFPAFVFGDPQPGFLIYLYGFIFLIAFHMYFHG